MNEALSLIDEWIGPQGPSGVGAVVWHRGEIVAERYAGEARSGVLVSSETLFPLASVSKPITAATFMAFVDDGTISLDEPVGRLLPEFRAGPEVGTAGVDPTLERLRPTISARQLLCHVSGLPEDLGPRESRYQERATIESVIDQMCRLPLRSAPGEELRYSNAGYGVIARLTERVSGKSFWQVAQERVLDPLGIRDIMTDPAAGMLERVAHLSDTNHPGTEIESYNSAYWRSLSLPWGGLFGTPGAAAGFAGAFLPSGLAFPLRTRNLYDEDRPDTGRARWCRQCKSSLEPGTLGSRVGGEGRETPALDRRPHLTAGLLSLRSRGNAALGRPRVRSRTRRFC